MMKKILKWTFGSFFLLIIALGGFGLWILLGSKTSNPNNYASVGDIPTPWGYERVEGDDAACANFLRSLPLKGRGSRQNVSLYTNNYISYKATGFPFGNSK